METQTQVNTIDTAATAAPLSVPVRGIDADGNMMFAPYDPKAPVTAPDGYRVAKLMYKVNPKTKTAAGENSCVVIRKLDTTLIKDAMDKLLPHVVGMLEAEQDKIIKSMHVAGETIVKPEYMTIDNLIEVMNAEAVSGRLNKEQIETWFTSQLENDLTILFADKLGVETVEAAKAGTKLAMTVKVYKDMFCKLASNTTQYQKHEAEKLLQAIEVTDADKTDSVTIKLAAKLDKMANPATQEELLALL